MAEILSAAGSRRDIIVIGASAGAVEALSEVARSLPANLGAAVLVVFHRLPSGQSMMANILNRCGPVPAVQAENGQDVAPGHIYIAPPDHHLLIKDGRIVLTRGPKENSARPSIDPLFRTAARWYGRRVIGVVLTGNLDDGTAGLAEIKACGGLAVVQDPRTAAYPGMPRNALDHVVVDYVRHLHEIGPLLIQVSQERIEIPEGAACSGRQDGEMEPDPAEGLLATGGPVKDFPGPPSSYTCPECHGTLWELSGPTPMRFRCRVGHAYSGESLAAEQSTKVEEALWIALRSLEERASLAKRLAARSDTAGHTHSAKRFREQADEILNRAAVVRDLLHQGQVGFSGAGDGGLEAG